MNFIVKTGWHQHSSDERPESFIGSNSEQESHLKTFIQSEDGSPTIEAVIWLPIYAFVLAIILNVTMIYFHQSNLLRVVQDSNRSFSIGQVTTLSAIEDSVIERTAYLRTKPTVNSQLVDGIVYTDLSVRVTDLMPLSILDKFFTTNIIMISAQQIVEF